MMKKIELIFAFLFVSFFILPLEPVVLDDSVRSKEIGGFMAILEDKTNQLSLNDVINSTDFKIVKNNSPSFGFKKSSFWLKFKIIDKSSDKNWVCEIAYPLMDHIDFYYLENSGVKSIKTGYSADFNTRDISHRNFVFNLHGDKVIEKTYYLRFQNEDRMDIPVKIWEKSAFEKSNRLQQFILGIYYGFFITMILYNLILFFSFKSLTYLLYVLFLFAFSGFQLIQNGLMFEFLTPAFFGKYNHIIPQSIGILLITIFIFTKNFLDTKLYSFKFNLIINYFIFISSLFVITGFFIPYAFFIELMVGMSLIGAFILIIAAIKIMIKGFMPARFFLTAWSFFIAGSVMYALKVIAVVPTNFFTTYAIQIGCAIMVFIISLGLGNRITLIKREKERARVDALKSQLESIDTLKKSEKQLEEFLLILSSTIESRDLYTGGHVDRVANIARDIALELGFTPEDARKVYLGAIVHDIGKIGISDTILNKKGKLTKEEYELIKEHTTNGYEILSRMKDIKTAAMIALYHQERWDGSGYPEGLLEKDIPIEARIVTIADYWDAIITDRPYRNAMDFNEALKIMKDERGKAFDPEIFDVFLKKILKINLSEKESVA